MAPFLSTRMSPPNRASCTSPARITASIAVARNWGGTASATGRQLLDHAHFHAPFVSAPKSHVVHEVAHEKDAASARFEDVLGRQRIGDLFGIEALALVEDPDDQLARSGGRRHVELDGDQLAVVLAVAVLDGVDDRFAHRDADPVDRVLVQTRELPDAIAHDLDEIQHFEITVDLKPYGSAAGQHAGRWTPARRVQDAGESVESAGSKHTRVTNIVNRICSRLRML